MKKQKKSGLYLMTVAAGLFLFSGCGGGEKQGSEAETAAPEVSMEAGTGHNSLSEAEKAEGWKLLFDGNSLAGWHGYKSPQTKGWMVEDGVLTNEAEGAGDIVSDGQYGSFELKFDWKVPANGNSGLMYRVVEGEEYAHPWATGPEYQILDDHSAELKESLNPAQFAASNYDMQAPAKSVSKPTGEWNEGRLVVNGNHVEHWLNGEKVVEYELGSDAWKEQVQNCKWKDHPGYGKAASGHLAFQGDHTKVWLRNIKIKQL